MNELLKTLNEIEESYPSDMVKNLHRKKRNFQIVYRYGGIPSNTSQPNSVKARSYGNFWD
jgi:predicted CopG family antitoxin